MPARRCFVVAVALLAVRAASAEEVVSLEAPRAVRAELDRLSHADLAVREAAATALGANDRNGPFLRFERVAAVTDAHKAALAAALRPIDARLWARHRDQVAGWAKARRLDLLCEYLAGCSDDDVPAALDSVLAVQFDIFAEAKPSPRERFDPAPGFIPARSVADLRHRVRAPVGVPRLLFAEPRDRPGGFVGRQIYPAYTDLANRDGGEFGPVIAASGELRTVVHNEWVRAVFLANGPVELGSATRLLVVADGDVRFGFNTQLRNSVVITSGSVSQRKGDVAILDAARISAGGSIDLPNGGYEDPCVFHAGGSVVLGPGREDKQTVVRNAAAPLYGVRFTAAADFGFKAEPRDGGMVVTAVEPASPLARYGVRRGDRIARVGLTTTTDAATLRRMLRRGLFDGAAVFHLDRGGERLTRVVYLDRLAN